MRAALLAALAALMTPALAANDPFLPSPPKPAKIVKALAPPDLLARDALEAFETATGTAVALDIYADAGEFAARAGEQAYDVMVLRGPALARREAAGGLARLDRRRLPNSARVQPQLMARFAAYDRDGAYGVPLGWSAFGLLYDADRIAPASWTQALGLARERPPDCGIVWPNLREESFYAVWRLTGVDATKVRLVDVKSAAEVLAKTRSAALAFAAPDEVGALAKGAGCLGAGTAGEAAAAVARGGDTAPNIRFAYPREGAPLAIYAFAIPADSTAPDAAYALIDALLAPDAARRNAAAAGLNDAEAALDPEATKRVWPEPVLDPAVVAAMQAEWKRLTAPK